MQRQSAKTASWEIYSGLKARAPLIARADGRGFKKILEDRRKPFDLDFARSMANATESFFVESGLSPILGFTFSDEISLLFLEPPFGGRVEKIDSLISGFLSSALTQDLGRKVSMDCRTIPLCLAEVADYLAQRQDETWRNHVFSYGFYMLLQEGLSSSEAMARLRGMKEPEIHEQVFQRGVNLARTPSWERRGVMIYRKEGRAFQDWELPLLRSGEGKELLEGIAGIAGVRPRDRSP